MAMFLAEKLYTYDAPSLFGEASLQGKKILILSPTYMQASRQMETFVRIWGAVHPEGAINRNRGALAFQTGGAISYEVGEEDARGLTPDIVVIPRGASAETANFAETLVVGVPGGRVVNLNTF
jgi:hypothetical protein